VIGAAIDEQVVRLQKQQSSTSEDLAKARALLLRFVVAMNERLRVPDVSFKSTSHDCVQNHSIILLFTFFVIRY
jgi:hypothetical protein